jgi:hypothetical protein
VCTVSHMGWSGVRNGELLARAATAGIDAMLTMDTGIAFEQNLGSLPCSVVILKAKSNKLSDLEPLVPEILRTLPSLRPGTLVHVG